MKEQLKLHEAIAVVLLKKNNRTATCEEIADEINSKKLYVQKKGTPTNKGQIRLRTHPNTKSGKFYSHLFEFIEPNKVKLRNM